MNVPGDFDKLGDVLKELGGVSLAYMGEHEWNGGRFVARFTLGCIGSGCGSTPNEALQAAMADRANNITAMQSKAA